MEKFSHLSGLTKGSARNAWAALKKKLYATEDEATNTPAKRTPAGKAGKKRPPPVVLPSNAANDTDEEEIETPTKKVKGTKAKGKGKAKKAMKSEDDDEEEEDGFVKVKEEVVDEDNEG